MTAEALPRLLRRKKLLIFDFDGTLADTSPLHAQAFSEVFAPFGVAVDYAQIAGLPTEDAVDLIAARAGIRLSREQRSGLVEEKRERARRLVTTELKPLPGSLEFVLAARGTHSLMLCTSGSRGTIELSLGVLGIQGVFDAAITADDVAKGKPHPDPFLKVLEHGRSRPEDALVFEDSASGLAAASAAGIDCIQIGSQPNGAHLQATWTMLNEALAAAV